MPKVGDVVHLKMNVSYKTRILTNIVRQKHPILIVDVFPSTSQVKIATMSFNINQVKRSTPSNVLLDDWKIAGLHKPTYVDVSSTGIIDDSYIFKTIARITTRDLVKVSTQLSKTKQRQVIEAYKIHNTGEPEYLDYYFDSKGNKIIMPLGD